MCFCGRTFARPINTAKVAITAVFCGKTQKNRYEYSVKNR
jgi:hypothetical protein